MLGRLLQKVERPMTCRLTYKLIGSQVIYNHELGIEVHLPEKSRPMRLYMDLERFNGICGVCGQFGLIVYMVLMEEGVVLNRHLRHAFHACIEEVEWKKVHLKFREDLDDVELNNLPPRYMQIWEDWLEKHQHRFDPTEVR